MSMDHKSQFKEALDETARWSLCDVIKVLETEKAAQEATIKKQAKRIEDLERIAWFFQWFSIALAVALIIAIATGAK